MSTTSTKVTVRFYRETVEDCDGDAADLTYLTQDYAAVKDPVERQKYRDQDAARLAALYGGEWHFIGIRAKAIIRVDNYNGEQLAYSYFHELASNGVYGIESDSSEDHLNEVFKEECDQLRADIEAMRNAEFKS